MHGKQHTSKKAWDIEKDRLKCCQRREKVEAVNGAVKRDIMIKTSWGEAAPQLEDRQRNNEKGRGRGRGRRKRQEWRSLHDTTRTAKQNHHHHPLLQRKTKTAVTLMLPTDSSSSRYVFVKQNLFFEPFNFNLY